MQRCTLKWQNCRS